MTCTQFLLKLVPSPPTHTHTQISGRGLEMDSSQSVRHPRTVCL